MHSSRMTSDEVSHSSIHQHRFARDFVVASRVAPLNARAPIVATYSGPHLLRGRHRIYLYANDVNQEEPATRADVSTSSAPRELLTPSPVA